MRKLLWHASFLAVTLQAQEPATRAEQVGRERREKAKTLEAEVPPKAERIVDKFTNEEMLEKIFGRVPGFRLRVGQLVTRSGFALGPEYHRPDLLGGTLIFRTGISASLRRYYKVDAYLGIPRVFGNPVSWELYAKHLDAPRMDYYGPGRESRKQGRSNFRLEETSFDFRAAWKARRSFQIGLTGGVLDINVGPGKDLRFISTDLQYTPAQTPGIQEQTNFLRGGPFLEWDMRDSPSDPHAGSRFMASYIYHHDREVGRYSFKRFTASADHYIPFLNKKRVIALRGKTEISYRTPGSEVPFYLQPAVGGSEDLRGYRQFRFRDNNSLVVNAEYRWEAFPALDLALFADGGKVFRRLREFDLRHTSISIGFGFRFKTRDSVAARFDVGFSREGFQIWFKFNDVFTGPSWRR